MQEESKLRTPPKTHLQRRSTIKESMIKESSIWPARLGPKLTIFGLFVAKLGPETPLERLGVKNCAGCTKNQPKRHHLDRFRD